MKKIVFSLFLFCVLIYGLHAETYLLPQVANGGGLRTTFVVTNTSATDTVMVTIQLTTDTGGAFTVTIPGAGTSNRFTFSLAPGSSQFLQTDGTGTLTAGAATITTDRPVGVLGIFSQFDDQGGLITEAGVGNATTLDRFTVPVDVRGSFSTGVALFNPGSSAVTLTLYLLDLAGVRRGTQMITLPPLNHVARFTAEIFSGLGGFTQGSLSVIASGPVAAVALRLNTTPRLALTTLPVVTGATMGTEPPSVSFAGSFDGNFTGGIGGNVTFILRQPMGSSQVTGGFCHEFSGDVIRASSVSTMANGNMFMTDGIALLPPDASGVRTTLNVTQNTSTSLTGTFTTTVDRTVVSGSFTATKLPQPAMLDTTGTFTGRGYNTDDGSQFRVTVNARQTGSTFSGDISAETPIGTITGSATGTVIGDRIENLTLVLSTPLGPATLSGGSAFLSSDGRIICGSLASDAPVSVHGSFVLRRR
jgi:hypothetical protein